jgi:aspartate/methionine/tyrosine aminotransferase
MMDLASGEALWDPFRALELMPNELSAGAYAGLHDEMGMASLRDVYCRTALGCSLAHLQSEGFDVLITNGAKEALWVAFAVLVRDHGSVLMPHVAWRGYRNILEWLGLRAIHYDPARPETSIARLPKSRTGVLLLNYPHNPTCAELSNHDADAIREESLKARCPLIFDDTLRVFSRRPRARTLSIDRLHGYRHAIRVDSASKWLGIPGVRVGFAIGARNTLRCLARYRDHLSSGVSVVSQTAVERVLGHPALASALEARLRHLRALTRRVTAFLKGEGCRIDGSLPLYVWARPGRRGTVRDGALRIGGLHARVGDGANLGAPGWFRLCPHNAPELGPFLAARGIA